MSGNGKRAHVIDDLIPYASMADNIVREACIPSSVADSILYMANSMCGLNEDLGGRHQVDEMTIHAFDYARSLSWGGEFIAQRWEEYFKSTFGL